MARYDVVVVGAGIAGCYASYLLAKGGLNVALLERKGFNDIGYKVCGDAIGRHHFDNLGLDYPKGEELDCVFEGVEIYSPNEEYSLMVPGEGFGVNRKLFGRRLLKMALDVNVELYSLFHVSNPIIENGYVVGVEGLDSKGDKSSLYSSVVVDASGFSSIIRSRLPKDWWINEPIKREDTNICYREIVETNFDFDKRYAMIYLSKNIAPGGYWWLFPKGDNVVNVGLGVQPIGSYPNPRTNYVKFIASRREFRDYKVIDSGGGIVPTRRPIYCPVGNGVVAIGDALAACNPIHGGGIGPSLISAKHASEVILKALENGMPSIEALWDYCVRYISDYGLKQASLDLFRMFLQKLSDDDLDFAFKQNVISGEDVDKIGRVGELSLNVVSKVGRALKLISKPSLLYRLKLVVDYMERIKNFYRAYPKGPADFQLWRKDVEKLIMNFNDRIS
ncbi:MAG: NAD(P)/FAD-dependent oxidoreductase [Candidatus Methanomethylicia archaeon]